MRGCFMTLGIGSLLVAAVSIVVLVKIGGSSDGPGALLFYIGAAGGLWGGWLFISPVWSDEGEVEDQ